jgi:hypothetical protein
LCEGQKLLRPGGAVRICEVKDFSPKSQAHHNRLPTLAADAGAFTAAFKRALGIEPGRERKPRRKSLKVLRAGAAAIVMPTGERIEIGKAEPTDGQDKNEWDAWEANRHAH